MILSKEIAAKKLRRLPGKLDSWEKNLRETIHGEIATTLEKVRRSPFPEAVSLMKRIWAGKS